MFNEIKAFIALFMSLSCGMCLNEDERPADTYKGCILRPPNHL